MSFHPGIVLLAWAGLAAVLQSLPLVQLGIAAVLLFPVSLLLAGRRASLLLRRARWLLLSIAVLFAFATPGERLPGAAGDAGLTWDGLGLAAEHALRLALLLATLALVHERLGTAGLVAGLHWLLAPLSGASGFRERIVVRLMLVLDFVEGSAGERRGWRDWLDDAAAGPERLSLATARAGLRDWLALALLAAVGIAWSTLP